MKKPKLIAIVGQTASGKSNMAMDLAKEYASEIICVDSRTVYKGMDKGTAKPTKLEQNQIKHHLLDIVSPDQEFTVADMKRLANERIEEISARGNTPILAGGTGLYINAIAYDFQLGGKKDKELRAELEKTPDEDLREKAKELGISEDRVNFSNRRHLIRAIERGGTIANDNKLRDNCLVIGIDADQKLLKSRISNRIDKMISSGLEKEARALAEQYGFDAPGMQAIGYQEWRAYFDGEQSIEEVKQKLYKNTWQFARRQKTWFKRDKNIHWITSVKEASVLVQQFLIQ